MGQLSRARETRPYGEWRSALPSGAAERLTSRISDVGLRAGRLRWVERRPEEGGRSALMIAALGEAPREVLPEGLWVRTGALTYGGRCVTGDGDRLWGSLHRHGEAGEPRLAALGRVSRPLTAARPWRFAEPVLDLARGRLICTWEDAARPSPLGLPRLSIAAVPLEGGDPTPLVTGRDLLCAPCLSPDGRQLAWLAWDYPSMPWDGAELWLAALDAQGRPVSPRRVAGGPEESCQQPRFSARGELYFLSDREGAWRPYRHEPGGPRALQAPPGELGVPQWRLGPSTWALLEGRRAAAAVSRQGRWSLHLLDLGGGAPRAVETGCTWLGELCAEGGELAFVGGGPRHGPVLYRGPAEGPFEAVQDLTPALQGLEGQLSEPEPFSFDTPDGGRAHAVFYAPTHEGFEAPAGERPPLIIRAHGGPTSATHQALDLDIQRFTSRGYAVVDVDYRGSSGYGRAYRLALYGRWGELDVMDCAAAARHLIREGRVDGARVLARGGSAGGFTTLGLAAFTDLLRAGVSYYGVSDLLTIGAASNNLERFYPDALVGPLPEAEALYRERSPCRQPHRVSCPMLFFQGEEDPGVPAQQTRDMVAALRAQGTPTEALYFEGEGHGFRRAETLRRCEARELAFYAEVLGLSPPAPSDFP